MTPYWSGSVRRAPSWRCIKLEACGGRQRLPAEASACPPSGMEAWAWLRLEVQQYGRSSFLWKREYGPRQGHMWEQVQKGGEDPSLGEGSNTAGAEEEEGTARTSRKKVKGRNNGEDPTSGAYRWQGENEKAQRKGTWKTGRAGTGGHNLQEKEAALRYRLRMPRLHRHELLRWRVKMKNGL